MPHQYTIQSVMVQTYQKGLSYPAVKYTFKSGFPLYLGIEIHGLFKDFQWTLKLYFQGPRLNRRLQHGQYYSNI